MYVIKQMVTAAILALVSFSAFGNITGLAEYKGVDGQQMLYLAMLETEDDVRDKVALYKSKADKKMVFMISARTIPNRRIYTFLREPIFKNVLHEPEKTMFESVSKARNSALAKFWNYFNGINLLEGDKITVSYSAADDKTSAFLNRDRIYSEKSDESFNMLAVLWVGESSNTDIFLSDIFGYSPNERLYADRKVRFDALAERAAAGNEGKMYEDILAQAEAPALPTVVDAPQGDSSKAQQAEKERQARLAAEKKAEEERERIAKVEAEKKRMQAELQEKRRLAALEERERRREVERLRKLKEKERLAKIKAAQERKKKIAAHQAATKKYRVDLYQSVLGNVVYPERAKQHKIEGSVKLRFKVDLNGEIKDMKVIQSSGSKILDVAALKAVYRTSAPEFGSDILTESVELILPISFRI